MNMFKLTMTAMILCAGFTTIVAQEQEFKPAEPAKEHALLKLFAGEWDCENEMMMVPGQPPETSTGTMSGRMIGNLWAVVEVKVDAPEAICIGQATFGFDSMKSKKYVGTWTDAMTPFLWKYVGTAHGKKLVFDTEGPHPADAEKMIKARDIWDFKNDDLLVLTSEMEGPDGKMTMFMKATCRRKK